MNGMISAETARMRAFFSRADRLWAFTNKGKTEEYRSMSFILLGSLLMTLLPLFIGRYIDTAVGTSAGMCIEIDPYGLFVISAVTVLILFAWYVLTSYGRAHHIRNMSANRIRAAILTKVDAKHIDEVEGRSVGELTGYISNDVPKVAAMMIKDIPAVFENMFLIMAILVLMIFTNTMLALIYIILFAITFSVTRYIGRRMRRDVETRQESLARMNSYLDDVAVNHSLVKLYGLEGRSSRQFARIVSDVSGSYRRAYAISGFVGPVARIVENMGFIVTVIIGTHMMAAGLMGTGMFLTFTSYASLIGRPLFGMNDAINCVQDDMISLVRILDFLDSDEIDRSGEKIDGIRGDIIFDHVSFSYGDRKALDDVSMHIGPGETVALIGVSGSGKSTVIDLILGLCTPAQGSVSIDGKDVSILDKDVLRGSVRLSPPIPWIFTGTILENIGYVREDATREEIIAASERMGFDPVVRGKRDGYDTVIGYGSENLSTGERQMLSLVRLALLDPNVMVIDESLSCIDPVTKRRIGPAVSSLLDGRTAIIISDDPEEVRGADRVIFMKDGRVEAEGTHEELIACCGPYRGIFGTDYNTCNLMRDV